MSEERAASEFTRLLEYLKASRGFDFGAYKVSSLMRRIQKRMRDISVNGYAEYLDYLEVHPHEFEPLFDTVLINVTSFFRDSQSWTYLCDKVLPRIVESRESDCPLRIWSAGCATGEEPYTLAMAIAEALGEDELRRARIYATDADENALTQARQGTYEARQIASVPEPLLDKYFQRNANRFVFRNDLRRCLIFGRHDLIQDAAISRLDLLVCRNTLMYFNAETQEKILARFHFALNRTGYLFLGKAETLLTHGSSFRPVDLRHRIFMRAPTTNPRDRYLAFSLPGVPSDASGASRLTRLRESAFDATAVAQVVIDRNGFLVLANDKARRLFGLGINDLGRVLQDFELSYRPVELRSHLETAYALRTPVIVKDVEWRGGGGAPRQMEVHVVPLLDTKTEVLGAAVAFHDLTLSHQLRQDLERAHQELETAFEELQSTNEELETTNEELQSTVEELETTNEELQSANEELETMNEELQSTNEGLRAMNDQIQQRSEELNQVNSYFGTILANLQAAVVVLDQDLQVKVWSPKAEELWGVRLNEVGGRPFPELDIGLPVEQLEEPLRQCLDGEPPPQPIFLDGVNRKGKPIRCQVQCTPLLGRTGSDGVILLIEETTASN
jgi:two-component system CheB/CheR fusion protein